MLKVTTLVIAAAAALGMSSASASTYPNRTRAEAQAFWNNALNNGWTTSNYGNVQRYGYNPGPTSLPPVANSGDNYTTIKRMGDGFTLEQRTYAQVPGRDLAHPVALQKPISKASMAKAFAKTLPILGSALVLKDLFDELFPGQNPVFQDGQWQYTYTSEVWNVSVMNTTGPTAYAACKAATDKWISENNPSPSDGPFGPSVGGGPTNTTCSLYRGGNTSWFIWTFGMGKTSGTPEPRTITEETVQEKLGSLFEFPPEVDPLLPAIPEQARKDLAQENKGPGVSVIPYTPDGQPSFEPWTSPESISTTSTQSSQEIITTTRRTTTTANPVQDGVRYDTTTTTTTETQKLDPVTGLPDGPPTTETTTETTEQTPSKPVEGEDLECGLPGTPPCKIDENGTPGTDEANFDKGEEEIENFKSGLLAKVQEKLDEITHEWTWTFALPTGCAALQFDTQVGPVVQIDMCEHQPMIHDIMSMIWAAAGVFGAMMIFLRSNG